MKYTVLIIEDSVTMQNMIKRIINKIENFTVIDIANDPYEARKKIKLYEPDLVTIDLTVPKMDGLTFLKNLMRLHPMPAIVISSAKISQDDIFDHNILEFIEKPQAGDSIDNFTNNITKQIINTIPHIKKYHLVKQEPLINKAKSIADLHERRIEPDEVLSSKPAILKGDKIIGIGSSTGGVESLIRVFEKLPNDLPPIVITQHIPYGFSTSFAKRLNENSKVEVTEVSQETILLEGHAYLAPGNMHLVIEKNGSNYIGKLLDVSKVSRHKPSVDIMFRSLNNSAGSGTMAIIMTGMGDDGKIAIKELYDNGAYTVAQNEESCVVFGMPRQAIKAGAVKEICHLDNIAQSMINFAFNL